MSHVLARARELKILEELYLSKKAEFLAIYGRRRVGKTFLIREFFRDKGLYIALTGVKGATVKKQLKNFTEEFKRVFGSPAGFKSPESWFDAFAELRKAIEAVKSQKRIILFFDELPWLATARSEFLQDLDHFWNRYMSEDSRVILVVCGSAASWMIKKIIRNKGGLYGRLTAEIRLLPFDLQETEEFLKARGVELKRKAIADLYMAIGGIPKYLNYIPKGQSPLQIVNKLVFDGPLTDEFTDLYASLFENHTRHISIVKVLAEHPGGLTKQEIAKKTGLTPGGGMNHILEELEQSGFILETHEFGKLKKDSRFRLVDEYSLFYLKWWPKVRESNFGKSDDTFWTSAFNSAQGRVWIGYAFEILCLKHVAKIKRALGISGVLTSASGWIYKPAKGSREKGAQIDLLIDRADNCINLCEIRYSNDEYVINKSCDEELRGRKDTFITQTKTKKSVFLTLISPYGVKKNVGYFDTVDVVVTLDDLF
ncbi:MAG: AAA family ATPase [Verrucomicrobia bacterium]|nr:AAA family ATPase [Verrucomicrobiota bacterium]